MKNGGDLITIHRRDIQAFVERSLHQLGWRKNGIWIGATDKHEEKDWRWVTGTCYCNIMGFNLGPAEPRYALPLQTA